MGESMFIFGLTDKTGNQEVEYYLTCLGLKSKVCDLGAGQSGRKGCRKLWK